LGLLAKDEKLELRVERRKRQRQWGMILAYIAFT
jgi:hypothetical protein